MPVKGGLAGVVAALEKAFGDPPPPPSTDPFELIVWENIAYLLDDAKRRVAFEKLRETVGITPGAIEDADEEALYAVARLGGMRPEERVQRLRHIAQVALELGDPGEVARGPFKEARKAFCRFPSTGEPGAEKILMICGGHPVLALESNGLRVLLRLGFGEEKKSYASSYRSVQQDVGKLEQGTDWIVGAHQQLKRHGQEVCRRTAPECPACPLKDRCAYFKKA